MKKLFSLIFIAVSFSAYSAQNPFDNFIGSYEVQGPIKIVATGTTQCGRYNLASVETIEVIKSDDGYGQSHVIQFASNEGVSNHPIMKANWPNDFGSGGVYAYTNTHEAINIYGVWGYSELQTMEVELKDSSAGVIFKFTEERQNLGKTVWSCTYSALLK